MPVLVVYNMPNRDIGQYSKGGAQTHDEYLEFIQDFANGIGNNKPIVIFEPDAIPHINSLTNRDEANNRIELNKKSIRNTLTHTRCILFT